MISILFPVLGPLEVRESMWHSLSYVTCGDKPNKKCLDVLNTDVDAAVGIMMPRRCPPFPRCIPSSVLWAAGPPRIETTTRSINLETLHHRHDPQCHTRNKVEKILAKAERTKCGSELMEDTAMLGLRRILQMCGPYSCSGKN